MHAPRLNFGSSLFFLGLFVALLAPASRVAAQQNEGFALNRFDIAEVGSDWFVGDSLDFRGGFRPGFRLGVDYAHKPLVRYDADGDEIAAVVKDQVHAHLGVGAMIADRLRLSVNLPVVLAQGGDGTIVNGMIVSTVEGLAVGDLRLAADLRIAGEYGDAISLAIGVQVHAPTGDRDAFAGDGDVRVMPRLMIGGDIAAFAYSVRAGFNYRGNDEGFGPTATGSEIAFVATAGVRVAGGALLLGPELWGSTVVSDGDAAFKKATTPFELLFGAHLKLGGFSAGLGVGPGLTQGIGSPAVRVVGTIAFVPDVSDRDEDGIYDRDDACPDLKGPENKDPKLHGCPDRDKDGIIDPVDACPDEPGVASDDPEKNGCPPVYDRDKDGIPDGEDACPDTPGVRDSDPEKNGCPPDRDGDGIIDDEDACPDEPGPRNSDPEKNGCPPNPDRDGDGIKNEADACPDVPGPGNEDPKLHGCPLARVEKDQIVISQRIEFEFNKAKLVPSSTPVLEAVLQILREHPEINEVLVEGHTDDVGNASYNKKLSDKRAAAVVKWLTDQGIEAARLRSAGIGEDRPLASNDDDVGRQKNRRVEFHIKKEEGASEEEESEAEEEEEPEEDKPSEKPKKPAPQADDDGLGDDPSTW
jgi:outer membrane protein OmpA-like peptidoglycan-associated protein